MDVLIKAIVKKTRLPEAQTEAATEAAVIFEAEQSANSAGYLKNGGIYT